MLLGRSLIAGEPVELADGRFTAGGALAPFEEASNAHVDLAADAAARAFAPYRRLPADTRATFLDRIARAIETDDDLVAVAHDETGLPAQRVAGERARTAGQLRMFAARRA